MRTFIATILLAIIIVVLLFALPCFADEINIPFSCWAQELKKEFNNRGKKLDLRSEERTDDSWGYLVNKGSSFIIHTYRSTTPEDFEIIKEIVFKIELEKRK